MKNLKNFLSIALTLIFVLGILSTAATGVVSFYIPMAMLGAFAHGYYFHYFPNGHLSTCSLVGWDETCDTDGSIAGIDTIWFASKSDIASLTITSGILTAITMVSTKVFYKWKFEPDTAFFSQPKTIVKRAPFIKHTLQFTNPKIKTTLLQAINALDACAICGLVAIVKDNNGKFWLAGVKVFSGGTYSITGIYPAASDGAVTGADAEADSNQITTAFEGKVGRYAIESTIAEGSIPV